MLLARTFDVIFELIAVARERRGFRTSGYPASEQSRASTLPAALALTATSAGQAPSTNAVTISSQAMGAGFYAHRRRGAYATHQFCFKHNQHDHTGHHGNQCRARCL